MYVCQISLQRFIYGEVSRGLIGFFSSSTGLGLLFRDPHIPDNMISVPVDIVEPETSTSFFQIQLATMLFF